MKKRIPITLKKLIEGYEEIIIDELSERLKDVVFMQAKNRMKESLMKMGDNEVAPEDEVTTTYNMHFVVTDILQIIGREKRRKNNGKSETNLGKAIASGILKRRG